MKKIFLLLFLVVYNLSILAQEKTFFLGHSLINFNVPNMVNKLSIAGGKTYSGYPNIGNGANLSFHYTNPNSPGSQGYYWDTTLTQGNFNNFILTEAVPLKGHLVWSGTYRYADSFYRFALQHNPTIQLYLYETWHCINSGTSIGCDWDNDDTIAWRTRLTNDLALWESIADSVNAIHSRPMYIIPAGQAMAQLYDSILAGNVPGITSLQQIYSDDIHLLNIGNYFIACLMYGIIHEESPVGLPNQLTDEWGTPYTSYPSAAQAAVMQRIAWRTICSYPRDGVNCSPAQVKNIRPDSKMIYPNPSQGLLWVNDAAISEVKVYTLEGKQVLHTNKTHEAIDVSMLTDGIYVLTLTKGKQRFVQKLTLFSH